MDIIEELQKNAKRYNKIVIWGLQKKWHTHRYIFQGYYRTLKKTGIPVIWVEDEKKNQKYIEPNDLIISAEVSGKMVPEKFKFEDYNLPVREDVYYCLHNFKTTFLEKINPKNLLKLQVYSNIAESFPKLYEAVHFDEKNKTLYQPWGTNLLPAEFREPVYNKNSFVFWVGSIWNDKNNGGNINMIEKLKEILKKFGLIFIQVRFVPEFLNIFFIRHSRIAPAISGKYQMDINYLPCRVFKNISYGQLGLTNVKKFKDILKEGFVENNSMEDLIKYAVFLSEKEYINQVKNQQEKIKNYTYVQHLNNVFKLL